MLDYATFMASLDGDAPPAAANRALRALWFDARGRDDSAARAVAGDDSHPGLRVRAYLARKHGDGRAMARCYWQAGLAAWDGPLQDEWRDIVHSVLVQAVVEQAYT